MNERLLTTIFVRLPWLALRLYALLLVASFLAKQLLANLPLGLPTREYGDIRLVVEHFVYVVDDLLLF